MVPLASYDVALKADLMAVPRGTQAAFAAACAERLSTLGRACSEPGSCRHAPKLGGMMHMPGTLGR